MKNGAYQYSIKMSAPIGPRYGSLELNILNSTGNGFLTMFSKRMPISQVSCLGDSLRFSGMMETLLYRLPYTAAGTVNNQEIQVVFHTERGSFPAEGTAVADGGKERREA